MILNSLNYNAYVPTSLEFVILYLSELSELIDSAIIEEVYKYAELKLLYSYSGNFISLRLIEKYIIDSFLPSDIAAAYVLEGFYSLNYSPQYIVSFLENTLNKDLTNMVLFNIKLTTL